MPGNASTFVLAVSFALSSSACNGGGGGQSEFDLVSPNGEYQGKTYTEWAADWVAYVTGFTPPDCINPLTDTTGESCRLYQDPESPVFHLVGNYGGVSIRDACVVPAGKALFFPLLDIFKDNAGAPSDMLLSAEELRGHAEENFDLFRTDSLHLVVDGEEIGGLERGAMRSAPYTVNFMSGENSYTCLMVDGVEGEFAGYLSGYWALLAPLRVGAHTIEFGGEADAGALGQLFTIDIRYDLTVE